MILMNRKILDLQQGSHEWFTARLGMPTASNFGLIVTPTGKAVKGEKRENYKYRLLAERLTGDLSQSFVTESMRRGADMELQARAWYSLITSREVRQVGITILEGKGWACGASPDGLCEDRGLEIKCPLPHTIIGQLLSDGPPDEYLMQVQGNMWVHGLERWDLLIFSGTPGIPNRIFEICADRDIQVAFESFIPAFCGELDAAEKRLTQMNEES